LVRRLAVLSVVGLGLAACGSSATKSSPIVYGIKAGSLPVLRPYSVTIEPDGRVRGTARFIRVREIPPATVRRLNSEIARAHLRSRVCPGAQAGFPKQYIRVGGTTASATVEASSCVPGFDRVWADLVTVVSGNSGR
jgi:hypothetical protein